MENEIINSFQGVHNGRSTNFTREQNGTYFRSKRNSSGVLGYKRFKEGWSCRMSRNRGAAILRAIYLTG